MSLAMFLPCIILAHISFLNVLHAIDLNSSITAASNSTWKSPSGDFEFGFYPLPNGLFLVGTWTHCDKITHPNGTISQTIDNIGGDSEAASSAHMQDDGNFVLKDSNLRIVWESFDSPANTILPGQTLKSNQILYSKGKGASNYSMGNFMLEMQGDGDLILKAHQFSDLLDMP
ncbi:G-type lectin S-receptor serine/threonine-protein kinase LECRK3 [Trifolium repens]|nr:G-type lectin S-receptor serine/threonine-protein kinase LECRK3 [Trifolium repens]